MHSRWHLYIRGADRTDPKTLSQAQKIQNSLTRADFFFTSYGLRQLTRLIARQFHFFALISCKIISPAWQPYSQPPLILCNKFLFLDIFTSSSYMETKQWQRYIYILYTYIHTYIYMLYTYFYTSNAFALVPLYIYIYVCGSGFPLVIARFS